MRADLTLKQVAEDLHRAASVPGTAMVVQTLTVPAALRLAWALSVAAEEMPEWAAATDLEDLADPRQEKLPL